MTISNTFDMIIFRNKEKRVIKAIEKFYSGNITGFPFTLKELQDAETWYKKKWHKDLDETLLHRFRMMEQLIYRKSK